MQNKTKIKLGDRIIQLRKQKKMTQQQLATAIGISAPAVSKWETNTSYPDITLLCPLARVLDVSVDELLEFDQTLTKEEVDDLMHEVIACSRTESIKKAEDLLTELLYTYPTDFELKYHASVIYIFFRMQHPIETSPENMRWKQQYKKLLEEVKNAGRAKSKHYEKAVSSLASVALAEDRLKDAEVFLEELSKESSEYALLWSQYYVKINEEQKALKVIQQRLYAMVRKTQMSMISMMNEHIIKDPNQVLEICKIYQQVEQIFQVGGETSEGLFVEAYKRIGDEKKVKEHAVKMIYQFMNTIKAPNPTLFAPNLVMKQKEPVATMEMRKMLYEGIQKDELLKDYAKDENLKNAMQKLKESFT